LTPFSHLHVHTQYSLLDGAASIDSLYKKAINDKMPALAITDHGNMFGVFDFVSKAWKKTKKVIRDGKEVDEPIVKPIVGCEFYVVKNRHAKVFTKEAKDERFHQVLLAKNKIGYQNLVKLTSLGYIEGMYSKYPRIDKELIEKYHEGLIATTCCLGAYVPQTILNQGEDEAAKEFKWWLDMFGEDYYIEIQRHNIKEQNIVNEVLLKFAKQFNVPVIASNDSHYTDVEDYNAHDILLCINTGEKQATPGFDDVVHDDLIVKNKRFKFPNNQFYLKTTAEMKQLFNDIPESIDNTNAIVDKVEILNLKKDILLPAFPIPKQFQIHQSNEIIGKDIITPDVNNQWEYLKSMTFEGAKNRYGEIESSTQERIDFELFTIKTMGFAGYFLIVSDFIKAGREMGVFVGPGRGSAAGSVVAYCIGITNIDPIKYNLLFERFLNPDRKSMPDIDTDFDDDGRQKVIDYVVEKYGKNQVAQIVTYGTMAAKSSIKDVARVMDLPLAESNALAKLVSDKPGTKLGNILKSPLTKKDGDKSLEELGYQQEDIENAKIIREIYSRTNDLKATILKEAERLEGSVRNTGLHAAGIIIAPSDLTDLIPIATSKDSALLVTQIEGKVIEDAGVIKMDFLGLKTLSIIKTALELIKLNHNKTIDIDNISLEDNNTFELFQKANAVGVFQFEAPHLVSILKDMQPTTFEDLIALNALNRPGPAQYIPKYIKRKHGKEPVEYDLPEMEEYLAETFGITVYQEQVMLLSQKLAGFTKGKADGLRKAMGKKDKVALDSMKEAFINGALAKNHPIEKLEKVWTDWEAFAQYAFNKSHSTCYAFVAYQTAYLKANYPSEFMSAVLNHSGAIEKITFFMEECKRMGIKVLGPDINESIKGFAPNKKGEIRFGLGGLKGVGESAIESLIDERKKSGEYLSIFDFIKRVNQRTVNKKSLESLAYSGSFDCFSNLHRAQYFNIPEGEKTTGIEKIIGYGQMQQQMGVGNNNTLFGDLPQVMDVPTPKIGTCEVWSLTKKLEHEKDVTGMYMSGHPLDHYKFELKYYGIKPIVDFNELKDMPDVINATLGKNIKIAGLVTDAQHRITKTGKNFARLVVEDFSGKTELMLWSEDYVKFTNYLEIGKNLLITGYYKQSWKGEGFEFKFANIHLLETAKQSLTKQVELSLQPATVSLDFVNFIEQNIKNHPGKCSIKFNIYEPTENLKITMYNNEKGFTMNDDLSNYLLENLDIDVNIVLN
jgi:DNA polymerase III subunit alpha